MKVGVGAGPQSGNGHTSVTGFAFGETSVIRKGEIIGATAGTHFAAAVSNPKMMNGLQLVVMAIVRQVKITFERSRRWPS